MESSAETIVREEFRRGSVLWLVLYLAVPALIYFIIGFDQGHIAESGLGLESGVNRIHELVHDARHASGFMCH
jgi:hypothetical protein